MGSALHEAALFGKTDVVQILLAAGEVGSAGRVPARRCLRPTGVCVVSGVRCGPGSRDC